MEFLFRGPLLWATFYPSRQPARNIAAGGFFGAPLPSRLGDRRQPLGQLGWDLETGIVPRSLGEEDNEQEVS